MRGQRGRPSLLGAEASDYGAREGSGRPRGRRARNDGSAGGAESRLRRTLGSAGQWESLGTFRARRPMARASRSDGLPPLAPGPPPWAQAGAAGEEPWERRRAGAIGGDVRGEPGLPVAGSIPCLDQRPGGAARGQPWWAAPPDKGGHPEAGAADPRQEAAADGPVPPALQRLLAVLLRLHRERERLLQVRDCARHLQAAVRLLRTLDPGAPFPGPDPWPQLCRDLLPPLPRKAALRTGLRETPEPLLLARPVGLAAQRLEAVIETQLRALGRAPASPVLSSQLADLLLALPTYHQLQGKALDHVPGAARPFPPGRVLCLLAEERGYLVAGRLNEALRGSGLWDQLRAWWCEERELLLGLSGLIGGVAGPASSGPGLGGAGALWSQYWTLLWAACAQSLDLRLGPWRDPRAAAPQLSQGEWWAWVGVWEGWGVPSPLVTSLTCQPDYKSRPFKTNTPLLSSANPRFKASELSRQSIAFHPSLEFGGRGGGMPPLFPHH